MLLSKIRLAWAAGLFNGEGCTTYNKRVNSYQCCILGEKIYRQCKECVKQFMVGRYVKQLDRVINKEESCV